MKQKIFLSVFFLMMISLPVFVSAQTNNLQSNYFSKDAEIIAIANGEKTITLPTNDIFTSRGIEWRILNGLRLAGYEPLAMPYGEIIDSNKIKEFDNQIFESEKVIYEKASRFSFYEEISEENFKDNLPSEFGAYNLINLFDLLNSGDVKYQKYTKECLFATLYPKNPKLVNRGTNGSSPREEGVFVLPFKIQQWYLYGFDAQAHSWNVNEDLYPETAIPSTYIQISGNLHEWVHELDKTWENYEWMHEAYDRKIYCSPYLMDFNYDDQNSPFNLDKNRDNGLSNENFVSQYAGYNGMEQPYAPYFPSEDAAESVSAYVLVPEYFRERMGNSEILEEKYNYIKENIFNGVEFENLNLKDRADFIFPNNIGEFYNTNGILKFKISDIKVLSDTSITSKDITDYGSISGEYVESSFKFMNGWNLIHGLPNPEWISGGDIESSNIKAIYGFNPTVQDYIRFYPQPEKNKLNNQNTHIDSMISATAFWVYIDSPTEYGKVEYWTLKPNEELNKQMLQGWNFVSILPDYIGKSFNELKGDCDIQKLHWWQPRDQEFMNILSDKEMEVLRYPENIGSGFLIKVPESCTLFASTSGSSDIPNVPWIPNIKECTDSDGGTVIDVKGLTGDLSTGDAYNDICFIKESATETTSVSECSGSNCYLKEYSCDSQTGNSVPDDISCSKKGFDSCKEGACIN